MQQGWNVFALGAATCFRVMDEDKKNWRIRAMWIGGYYEGKRLRENGLGLAFSRELPDKAMAPLNHIQYATVFVQKEPGGVAAAALRSHGTSPSRGTKLPTLVGSLRACEARYCGLETDIAQDELLMPYTLLHFPFLLWVSQAHHPLWTLTVCIRLSTIPISSLLHRTTCIFWQTLISRVHRTCGLELYASCLYCTSGLYTCVHHTRINMHTCT